MSNTVQLQQAFYSNMQGCQVTVQSATPHLARVSAGVVRDQTNSFDISIPSATSVDMLTTGIGGIGDGSALAADTSYAVYVIGRSIASGGNSPALGKVMALPITDPNSSALPPYSDFLRDADGVYDIGRFVGWVWGMSPTTLETQVSFGNSSGIRSVLYPSSAPIITPYPVGPLVEQLVPFSADSRIPVGAFELYARIRLVNIGAGGISGQIWSALGSSGNAWISMTTDDRQESWGPLIPCLRKSAPANLAYIFSLGNADAMWEIDAFGYRHEV